MQRVNQWSIYTGLNGETKFVISENTVKPVLSAHSKRTQKMVFKTHYRLMQVKSIAESATLSTFIKLLFSIATFVLSIFKWPHKTGFTVHLNIHLCIEKNIFTKTIIDLTVIC